MTKSAHSHPSDTTVSRDPRERFVTLANNRVSSAIKQLRLIGNLSNKKNYVYTKEDAAKIVKALQREIDVLRTKFKGEDVNDVDVFRL